MTRVYQELLTVGRDANEMYLVPVPAELVGRDFVEAASVFLRDRTNMKACLLIGVYRGETMMLNPVGGEAGPLHEGDELILLSQSQPDLSRVQLARKTCSFCAAQGTQHPDRTGRAGLHESRAHMGMRASAFGSIRPSRN